MFDRSKLTIKSAANRKSLVYLRDAKEGVVGVPKLTQSRHELDKVVKWLTTRKGPAIWFLGGHVFKANVGWYLSQLHNYMSHVATNGAGLVHAYELKRLGHTSEDVATAIKDGSFGMWSEVGEINDIVNEHFNQPDLGIGKLFEPLGLDLTTVHTAVGQDIFCMHPNYMPRAWGEAAYIDFLKFALAVEHIQHGTFLVFGSAVCAPEVFLKALSMARNGNDYGKPDDIAIAVFDCVEPPEKEEDRYYNRPAKTLLGRIANEGVFVHGRHEETIPNLWKLLCT